MRRFISLFCASGILPSAKASNQRDNLVCFRRPASTKIHVVRPPLRTTIRYAVMFPGSKSDTKLTALYLRSEQNPSALR